MRLKYDIVFAVVLCVVGVIFADDLSKPITIDPLTWKAGNLFLQKCKSTFYIDSVIDKRSNAGSDSLGTTRTSRDVYAPLVCAVHPDSVLKKALENSLDSAKGRALQKNGADYMVCAELLQFDIVETSKLFSQDIKAVLQFRIRIKKAANDSLVRQFLVNTEDDKSSIDTTPLAKLVAANALVYGMQNVLETFATIKKGE
jgi:hypothetical protein